MAGGDRLCRHVASERSARALLSVSRALLFLLGSLLLAGCRPTRLATQPELPDAEARKHWLPRTLFERVRELGGFTREAYVVWTPLWPKPKDELLVLYDLEAPQAPLREVKALEWTLHPESGEPVTLPLTVERGIGVLRTKVKDLRPGRFSFRAGRRVDDNCGNPFALPIVAAGPDWRSQQSEHFIYRWLPWDPVESRVEQVLATLEQRRAAIIAAAGLIQPPEQITFLHYPDRQTAFEFQAQRRNNADWSRSLVFSGEAEDDSHALARLLFFHEVGKHVGLFDEGVAIHFGQEVATGSGWKNRPCDDWAREALAGGGLAPLRQLLTPKQVHAAPSALEEQVYFPAGCSFVGYLVQRFGAPRLKLFLRSFDCDTQQDPDAIAEAFKVAFGAGLDATDNDWRKSLNRPR